VSIRVAPVRDEHIPRVLKLLDIGLREEAVFAAQCDPPEDDGFLEAEIVEHRDALHARRDEWVVALDSSDSVVGVLWMRFNVDPIGPYGSVRQIIVDPARRRRGIGTLLLRYAEDQIRAADSAFFLISAFRTNPAWKLYRSLGFSNFPDEFKEDKNPEHVVLWKPLRELARPQTS